VGNHVSAGFDQHASGASEGCAYHPARLVDHGRSFGVVHGDRIANRRLAQPAARAQACQRILADLLRPIANIDADRVARRVIGHFGSLPAALAAPRREQLRAAGGDLSVVQQLRAVHQAMIRARRLALDSLPVIGNERAVLDYVAAVQGADIVESVRVLYLDARNHLIREEVAARGTVHEAPIYVREIIARALELGAMGIIVAHNHPSGDTEPSVADKEMTAKLAAGARTMGIALHDHLIVSRHGHFSFRTAGLLC
jgi:DNA repair protein RadC